MHVDPQSPDTRGARERGTTRSSARCGPRGVTPSYRHERNPAGDSSWHAAIGKAILESWGLPEALQQAVEKQDEIEIEGAVTLTDLLIAAKLLARGEREPEKYAALRRVGGAAGEKALGVAEEFGEEIAAVRSSLSD